VAHKVAAVKIRSVEPTDQAVATRLSICGNAASRPGDRESPAGRTRKHECAGRND
jgi:hypothetical protein